MRLRLAFAFVPEDIIVIKEDTPIVKLIVLAGFTFCAALLLLSGNLLAKDQSEAPDEEAHQLAVNLWGYMESTVTPVAFAIQYRYEHGSWPNERDLLELIDLVEENPPLPPCALTILRSSDASLEMQYTVNALGEDDCSISVLASITRTEGLDDESYDAELETMPVRSGIGIGGGKSTLKSTCKPQMQCDLRWELVPSG